MRKSVLCVDEKHTIGVGFVAEWWKLQNYIFHQAGELYLLPTKDIQWPGIALCSEVWTQQKCCILLLLSPSWSFLIKLSDVSKTSPHYVWMLPCKKGRSAEEPASFQMDKILIFLGLVGLQNWFWVLGYNSR